MINSKVNIASFVFFKQNIFFPHTKEFSFFSSDKAPFNPFIHNNFWQQMKLQTLKSFKLIKLDSIY